MPAYDVVEAQFKDLGLRIFQAAKEPAYGFWTGASGVKIMQSVFTEPRFYVGVEDYLYLWPHRVRGRFHVMHRILVLYPCIVSFMYKYVLRSHRIVGYQYTYKIHKIYNFSGIQLNTHLMDTTEYSPVSSNMSIHQRYEELNTYS